MSERKAKVVQLGKAYAVCLPIDWCRGNRIRKGSVVTIEYNDGAVMILAPAETRAGG